MSKSWSKLGFLFLYSFVTCLMGDLTLLKVEETIASKNYNRSVNKYQMQQIWKRSENYNAQRDYTMIYVEKKPKINLKLKDIKVLRDQKAVFICGSIGNPVPTITWLVNKNHILPKRYVVEPISSQKSILTLYPVKLSDNRSRVTCQSSSVMGSSSSEALLVVYQSKRDIPSGFPVLVSKSSVIVNEKNTRIILECNVEGNPKPDIIWLKDSIPVDLENNRIKLLHNGDLQINKTLEDDEGGYECMATNKHGSIVSPMIKLMIRVSYFAPQFLFVPNDQVVAPGSSLTLKCKAVGNPIPLVHWQCGQTILQSHSTNATSQKAEANVILADLSESLKCTCVARNNKESISKSINVSIQEPSTAPAFITISHITGTSCLVSWNQKTVREDHLKYRVVIIKTSDLQNGKNTQASVTVNVKKSDSEMTVNTKLDNLSPFTSFTVWLESFPLQIDSIKSNLVTFTTNELPPNSPPRNVELSAISNGALIVTWDPPEIKNGIITGYSIYYTQYKNKPLSLWNKYPIKTVHSSNSKPQTSILSHLQNNVTYYISISAQNAAGNGPVTEPQAIIVRAGVVQGPKNFRAVAKSPTEIQFFWDPILSKAQMNVIYYNLVYMPKQRTQERISRRWNYVSTENTISIGNLQPNTTYTFYLSVYTASAKGMESIVDCKTSVTVCPLKFENVKLINSKFGGIEICWSGIIDNYKFARGLITFRSDIGNFSTKLSPEVIDEQICHIQINNMIPNIKYSVSIFLTKHGCKNHLIQDFWIITRFFPFEEPIIVTTQVLNSTTIRVQWKVTRKMRKKVEIYRLQCRRFMSNTKDFTDVYLKNSSIVIKYGIAEYVFTNLSHNTEYQIYLNTITRHHSGSTFKSEQVKTWPKKLKKLDYLRLRLSCSINHPCVRMEWKPKVTEQKFIKGYRVQFYPIAEDRNVKYKINERNVTENSFETSALDHYQGFLYEFKVAAFSEFEIGEENTDQIFILEGIPSVPPPGFRLKLSVQQSPTSISFMWDKLPQHTLNGKFNQYEVSCFILTQENKTKIFYKTKTESITINNLVENANYACQVRVWIQKSYGMWSDRIDFKTKNAHLPPPEAIRLIRLSHSTAHITWKWKPDFLKYYSHFIVYYANEKDISNQNHWFSETTKSAFTKFILSSLNETIHYAIKISSVTNNGIEGPLSSVIKETNLYSESWPAKFVNQLSCAPESSTVLHLRWSAHFDNEYLTHFRINFTGVTKFQSDQGLVSKMRDEQEQSALVSYQKIYFSHQIQNLRPNTIYTIDIEPIFAPEKLLIGTPNHTICTTFKEPPTTIAPVELLNIDKRTNKIELLLQRPNLENGTVDVYYINVKVVKNSNDIYRRKRSLVKETLSVKTLIKNNRDSHKNQSNIYTALFLKHDDIFPSTNPKKHVHKITLGTGAIYNEYNDQKLQQTSNYKFQIQACIQVSDSQNTKLQCNNSPWTNPVNIKESVVTGVGIPNSNKKSNFPNKGPSTFTTATVVFILGIVILAVLAMSIFLFIKRRQVLKSKLGNVYGSHSNRMSKEKSVCMEQLLKEPLFDSSVRISTSGSLRYKNHGNNYLEINKLQLSSTPDLLVRTSVSQPMGTLVQLHGQHFANRHFDYAPIPIEALGEHVALLKENDGKLFNKEYESIEPGQQFTWNSSNIEVNRLKNRYANVIAYDHSRVVLQPLLEQRNLNTNETLIEPGSDYINANYISGYLKPNAYIATQGPLAETIGDFWRMMWEQNSCVIVMMTRLEERDRAKCDQYWPLGGKGSIASYSYITVTIIEITELAYYTIRKFHIQKLNDTSVREVYQLQFTAWPDHGVPNHPAPLLMFLRRVHSEITRNSGPIVVHCSAGVGRTGAFIVIDYMLERLRYENTVDIYNYVTNIRAQRNYMVQTEDQYIFIYETLLEAVQCGNTEVPVSELANHIEKLNQIEITHKTADGIQMTGLQMEFENLVLSSEGFLQGIKSNANYHSHCSTPSTTQGNLITNYQPLTYETATQIVNQMKNRIIQILPPDFSRVNICPIRGVEGSDYINASWIDGYKNRRAYIAAQSPLPETCEDFWRALWEHNSSIIVMLTQLKENNRERCYQYWPYKRSSRYQFFIVDPVAEYNMTTYIIREFKLTDTRDSQSRVIRQFQFTDWQESESIPHSVQVFLDLINQVHKTKVQLGQDGPITVHCSAGTGRTGIFLALSNIIERMKNESVIDLFQTVKLLRWQRPALLQTEDQYHFCYLAALEYLKIFEQMRFDL